MTSLVVKNRNLYVPVETPWSSDETIPQNLTVYGYQYTNDTGATETKLYQYVKYQNDHYSGTINFVALDDPNPTAGQIGNSDTYWRYDPNTTTLFITGLEASCQKYGSHPAPGPIREKHGFRVPL